MDQLDMGMDTRMLNECKISELETGAQVSTKKTHTDAKSNQRQTRRSMRARFAQAQRQRHTPGVTYPGRATDKNTQYRKIEYGHSVFPILVLNSYLTGIACIWCYMIINPNFISLWKSNIVVKKWNKIYTHIHIVNLPEDRLCVCVCVCRFTLISFMCTNT